MRDGYTLINSPNPHIRRGREIVGAHPQVRELFGPYPLSGAYIAGCVALQLCIAYTLRDASWYWVIPCAYLFGAFVNHALFVLIHDATHNLIVKGTVPNRLFGMLCNVGQGIPAAMSFRTYHLLHHYHLDEYDYDADLAYHREARWVGNSSWRKALWLFLFAGVETIRPLRIKAPFADIWMTVNAVVIVITNLAIWYWCGWTGLAYILLSTLFGVGLHPVGARWIQEHYTFKPGQETYSYYGILNRVSFNIGYHNEHHDLVKVPWVYLPRLKAMAPEFYNHLYAHQSWTRVLLWFLFDPQVDLYARLTRDRASMRTQRQATAA
jgi:sphingolipid 4-desaturase/C4-monooxygenase